MLSIDAAGHRVHYEIYGSGSEVLIGLHGGPGAGAGSLHRLGELAGDQLTVVLYDQLGCGRSDQPEDPSLWAIPRFVEELESLREGLGLGDVHLLGRSWGSFLALQYALDHPAHAKTLIVSNAGASVADERIGLEGARASLGSQSLATLRRHEAAGDYRDPEYLAILHRIYARHVRRCTPFDDQLSLAQLEQGFLAHTTDLGPAFEVMWGPNELLCTGNLSTWDVTERLGEITVPVLIVTGWFDAIGLEAVRKIAARVPDNEFVILGNSSHALLMEKEGDLYLGIVRDFLRRKSQL
jgi:proline iminopeptidase